MQINTSVSGVNGFSTFSEALRAPSPAAPAKTHDSVTLTALDPEPLDAAATGSLPGKIAANAGDALAAHSRLDPERALRLLGMLDA